MNDKNNLSHISWNCKGFVVFVLEWYLKRKNVWMICEKFSGFSKSFCFIDQRKPVFHSSNAECLTPE